MIDLEELRANVSDSKWRIGEMCANLRPPKMSIPVSANDDDEFICRTLDDLLAYVDALREAAGRVTCKTCDGKGDRLWPLNSAPGYYYTPCPDCADLRALLERTP